MGVGKEEWDCDPEGHHRITDDALPSPPPHTPAAGYERRQQPAGQSDNMRQYVVDSGPADATKTLSKSSSRVYDKIV